MSDRLTAMILQHEGLRLMPYTDSVGKLTIGVGHNLSDCGIPKDVALLLLDRDIEDARQDLQSFSWFAGLSEARQDALIDMRFNLGASRFRGFKQMLACLERGDFYGAAQAMSTSLWARQVPRRANELSLMVLHG